MNVFTTEERANRACRRDCPDLHVPDNDGDAVQCRHGRWWVFLLEHDSGTPDSTSWARSGRWRRATPRETRMLRKASR